MFWASSADKRRAGLEARKAEIDRQCERGLAGSIENIRALSMDPRVNLSAQEFEECVQMAKDSIERWRIGQYQANGIDTRPKSEGMRHVE